MGLIDSAIDAFRFKDTVFYKENSDLQSKYDTLKKLNEEYPNNEELLSELFIVKKGLDGEKHIILITDGGENCDESPCKYAMNLVKYRKDIRIDVIAFNIGNEDDLDQLECVATVTKGKLYNADTKAELMHGLNNAFKARKEVDAKILY